MNASAEEKKLEPSQQPSQHRNRLFVRRVVAYLVDIALLFLILAPVGFLIQWGLGIPLPQTGPAIWQTLLWNFSLPTWLYFIFSDQTAAGATVGKRLLQIGVKGITGEQVSLMRALGRTIFKLLPWELVHLSAFALSTALSEFHPVQIIGLSIANLLTVLYLVVAAVTRGQRSMHDFVAGTVVVSMVETFG